MTQQIHKEQSINTIQLHFQDLIERESTDKFEIIHQTPLRKNKSLKKQILDTNISKTEEGKRQRILDTEKDKQFSLKYNIFLPSSQKQIKYTGCNCRKSQCLKMYCACFALGKMCDQTCLCDSCKNDHDNMDRSQAINEIIQKDPFAFSKKGDNTNSISEDDFCNCKKSNCMKKYCECYRRGRVCGSKCNCVDCTNCGSHQEQQKYSSDAETKKRLKFE